MKEMLKVLQQPEYIHVLINHIPLIGFAGAVFSLIIALITKNRTAILIGLFLVALFAGSTWPVIHYGEKGYERVVAIADEDGVVYLKHHMALGNRWGKLYYLTSFTAVVAGFITWRLPRYAISSSSVVVILSILSLGAGGIVAESGGKIRHPEFRTGPPPVLQPGLDHEHMGGMSTPHSMPTMSPDKSSSEKDMEALQLEASRLQLEASRLQLEASRLLLEKSGKREHSSDGKTPDGNSNTQQKPMPADAPPSGHQH